MSLLTAAGRWVQAMLQEEPVLTLAVIQSGVAMFVGFGLAWTGEQVGLVVGFSAAVRAASIIGCVPSVQPFSALWTRRCAARRSRCRSYSVDRSPRPHTARRWRDRSTSRWRYSGWAARQARW
jgi:hypothetical protein